MQKLCLGSDQSFNLVQTWQSTNITTEGDESGSSAQSLSDSRVDLAASDSVNVVAVVLEVQFTEGSDVLASFFQSILLSFEGHQDVRFKDIFGSFEFFTFNIVGQFLQFAGQDVQDIVAMAGRSRNAQSEQARVREVEVQAVSGINKAVLVKKVLGGSSPHALAGASSGEGG